MKKTFILAILTFVSALSFSQFVVSPALSDAIKDGKAEYLDVNIFFENVESVSDLALQFDNYHADFDTRVKGVTALLKRNYERSYAKFVRQIEPLKKANPDAVESMEGYWIVNAVNAKVSRDVIGQIAGFAIIYHIEIAFSE